MTNGFSKKKTNGAKTAVLGRKPVAISIYSISRFLFAFSMFSLVQWMIGFTPLKERNPYHQKSLENSL